MDTLAKRLQHHFTDLSNHLPPVPSEVEWLLPLSNLPESLRVFEAFLEKYYADNRPRTLILGINPGRFGAGVTNVAFTDPVRLVQDCGIENSFEKKEELSAQFVYKVVHAYGGVSAFYEHFFVNSVVPFGFVKNGVNYNYYDEKPMQEAMKPLIRHHLRSLLTLGMNSKVCFCLGEGKNFKFLSKFNENEGFFEKIVPLSHPRFIMQYRRKRVEEFVETYLSALKNG
ncbi:MAG: DUF4918 family protein [Saprospiraceae bacterium]|nr:DUF4918 family protein [Saprospiraceae bacterium]MCF8250376.1 DUF4918 family protein [Saprospiraceae bacterium]MCF8280387.1 DUF4918 family protein [Bacteroidales bacterium]MCF8312184.1 DUF4918 family protein [Saprospiraceae bacterium]MCF8441852.1 DUF4918 family protein [Saprospiraceae bacterium]